MQLYFFRKIKFIIRWADFFISAIALIRLQRIIFLSGSGLLTRHF